MVNVERVVLEDAGLAYLPELFILTIDVYPILFHIRKSISRPLGSQ